MTLILSDQKSVSGRRFGDFYVFLSEKNIPCSFTALMILLVG